MTPFSKRVKVVLGNGVDKKREPKLRLGDALRVKSAELWLEVGEPTEALLELQRLTKAAWKHPWTKRVFELASQTMG